MSSLVVIMAPGPDLVLITGLVLNRSARVATAAAFGMIAAGALQAGIGAAGLAAVFAARPDLFTAFRWTGAVVLLGWSVLALRRFCRPAGTGTPAPGEVPAVAAVRAGTRVPAGLPRPVPAEGDGAGAAGGRAGGNSGRHAFAQGLLCTGSNPKVGIFLMAFLPQFIPEGMSPGTGIPLLAVCYLALGLSWLLTWIRLVHRLAHHMRSARMLRAVDGITAVVFGVFAARLALGG